MSMRAAGATATATTAAAAAAAAEQVMAGAGKTFYQAARLLPSSVRTDVVRLYAFCRTIDDLADDPVRPLAERRARLLSVAEAFEQGDRSRMLAAGWPFEASGRRPRTAALLIRAALGDLNQQQPADEEELLAYAFGVAGTVGILMADVLHARPEGFASAIALGLAMQLTNICRDVAEDLGNGRVYLPADRVVANHVAIALANESASAAREVVAATLHLLRLADELYRAAFDGMHSLPWRIRWSILAAALCYREIGVQVRRDVKASWRRRTVVRRRRKLLLLVKAGLLLLQPRFWWPRAGTPWPGLLGDTARRQGSALGLVHEA